ncbi:transglutaminase-like domain-containing protein [Armatimonas sp.]|uniref:transglutaminase-like domain-containing protein n=1 Tax=Armatimonas sp. TaxID=1872638 RepID=UPI00286A00DC|nr:transglutaminase-like domain-containing protein [Armatimonas sp.]
MTPHTRPHTLPITTALFGLGVLLILFLVSKGTLWLLALLAILILASYTLRLRLPTIWLPSLLFGGILLGMAILSTPLDGPQSPAMIGTARATFLFGQAMAILMTLQFYRPTPSDPGRPKLFALLGGVFSLMASCNTFDEHLLRFLLPAILVVIGLALRNLRQRPSLQRLTTTLLFPALALALGTGWLGIKTVQSNRERLTEWGNRFMNERPQAELTGLSQQPTLGASFGARGSNARVLRLEGAPQIYHLRGAAYDTYDGSRWWLPIPARSFITLNPQLLSLPAPRGVMPNRITVTRLQSNDPLIFFPLETLSLELGDVEQMEWASNASGPVRVRANQPYIYFYQEAKEGFQGLMALPGLPTSEAQAKQLVLSEEVSAALSPLAQKITKDAKTPAEKVAAITSYLLENYTYSLNFRGGFIFAKDNPNVVRRFVDGKQMDMVIRFLLADPKQGAHCEYFASAAALLLRCVGVPTRYVTGYFAHEEEAPNTIIVRQRDAHAWCEAWVEGKGWLTVEATPPTGWPEQNKSPIEPWRKAWEWLEDHWQKTLSWLADREPAQLAMLLLGPFALIGLVVFWQRRGRKAAPSLLDFLLPPPDLAILAKRFEAVLVKTGTPLSPTEPWSERLTSLPEATQPTAKQFVTLYQQARFGGKSTERAALEATLQTLEGSLKKKP